MVKFVMTSSDSEFKANLNNYIDVNSLIDYSLYGLISTGLDAFGKNQLYMTYDGTKWFAGMYDMDSTWGLWWNGQSFVSNSYSREEFEDYKNGSKQGNLLYIRLQKLFIPQLKARYTELRQTIFTYPYLVNKFEEFIQICPQDIVKEDYANTTANGAYTGIPSKTTNNIQQLRANIDARLTYVDSYINSLVAPTPCTSISLNKTTLSFTATDAQTLTVTLTPPNTTDKVIWSVAPAGICTVDNGVVTPIKNGSCVITATCGNQTATCNVTVSIATVAVTALNLDKDNITLGSTTTDTSNINLLEGVDANVTSTGDLLFNEITLNKGFYVLKNINGGTFTWLKIKCNGLESTAENSTKEKGICVLEDNTALQVKAYPTAGDTENTKDKLGLYKVNNLAVNNSTAVTKIGDGYFIPGYITPKAGDNDEYTIVDLDISKKYCVKINSSSLSTGQNSCILSVKDTEIVNSIQTITSYYFTDFLIENANKLYMSIPKTVGITNVNLVEVTKSKPIVTTTHSSDTVKATLTPTDATNKNVTWTTNNGNVELVTDGLNCTVKAKAVGSSVVTCTSQDTTNGTISDTCNVTVTDVSDTPTSSSLIFKVDGTCLDTTNNILTDKVGGVQATLTGTPSLANNNLAFDDNSSFYFDLTSLNVSSINGKTFRVKFKPTRLDTQLRHVFGFGQGAWTNSLTGYVTRNELKVQIGSASFHDSTVGINGDHTISNALTSTPVTNTEYELIFSNKKDTADIRIFINGTLIQNGKGATFDFIKIFNNEGLLRFIGEYICVEVYSEFVDTYEEFTNLIK